MVRQDERVRRFSQSSAAPVDSSSAANRLTPGAIPTFINKNRCYPHLLTIVKDLGFDRMAP